MPLETECRMPLAKCKNIILPLEKLMIRQPNACRTYTSVSSMPSAMHLGQNSRLGKAGPFLPELPVVMLAGIALKECLL